VPGIVVAAKLLTVLDSFEVRLIVRSAGTEASGKLNEQAVKSMSEIGIDISTHTSDSINMFLNDEWDYVITVCGGANEKCPAFFEKIIHRLHMLLVQMSLYGLNLFCKLY
jgi:arsenate reductase